MKKVKRMLVGILLSAILLLTEAGQLLCEGEVSHAANSVTPSKQEYTVDIEGSCVYLGNKKEVDVSGGEAVYLTYTVASVAQDEASQSGVVVTSYWDQQYPYVSGMMQFYHLGDLLMKPGFTYFIKIEVTEFGLEYVIAYSNGKEEGYVTNLIQTVGELADDMKYAGIWVGAGMVTAKLTHVHCYDKKGNDLELAVKDGVVFDPTFVANDSLAHTYEFTVKDVGDLAITNAKYTKSDTIWMEYEIKNVTCDMKQPGFLTSNSPTILYPYTLGYMNYQQYWEGQPIELAREGAKYLIRFTKTEEGMQVTARYTLNGKHTYFIYPHEVGTYDEAYGYVGLWLGLGTLSATFTNFKCYDGEGKNLAVQTNHKEVEIKHYGGLEDYAPIEAMYYCKENNTLIALDKDCNVSIQNFAEETSVSGTYFSEDGSVLVMKINGQSSNYDNAYAYIKDEAENKYFRLKEYQVRFVTGTEVLTEKANTTNSYMVSEPKKPVMAGNEFKGWYLADGTEHDFGKIVTESLTLYAKWVDGEGNEYLATEFTDANVVQNQALVIALCVSALLVLATVGGTIYVLKKGKRHEKK